MEYKDKQKNKNSRFLNLIDQKLFYLMYFLR